MIRFLRLLLFPFAIPYFLVTELRNFLFAVRVMRGAKFDRPVICIGNLSTGGTGKTPMTEYILRLLKKKELQPAVLSRGYGRKIPGYKKVELDSKVSECGDEPLQIKKKFPDTDVAVCERRVDGIIHLVKENENISAILLDDAFQHRAVKSSLYVLTTSFEKPFFSDFILPVGDLREMRRNASRADVIVVSKCPDWMTEQEKNYYLFSIQKYAKATVYFSRIKYGEILPVFEGNKPVNLSYNVLLVTGIAGSSNLVLHLEKNSKVKHLEFGDHHTFSEKNLQKITGNFDSFAIDDKILLTTEKDAMRFRSMDADKTKKLRQLPFYYITIESEIIGEEEKNEFENIILSHVAKFE